MRRTSSPCWPRSRSAARFEAVYIEGIRHVSPLDIAFASEMGYRIKLLGVARRTEHGLEQRVHPSMVRIGTPISQVEGVFNAVVAEGDQVDATLYSGRGAGGGPTASAVVADIADIAKGANLPMLGVPCAALQALPPAPMEHHYGAYYFRLMVVDQPGVLADVAACLRDHEFRSSAHPARAQPARAGADRADHPRDHRGADDRRARAHRGPADGARAAAHDPDRSALRRWPAAIAAGGVDLLGTLTMETYRLEDRNLALEAVRVTERAAIAASAVWMGRATSARPTRRRSTPCGRR